MKTKLRATIFSIALIFCATSIAIADEKINHVVIKVEGLYCPFCAYGLEKHMKRIEGFRNIQINIKEGTAEIDFDPDAKVSKERISEAVDDAGFSLNGLTWIKEGSTK